jgi:hypothetical protein
MKSFIFRNIKLCSLLKVTQRFGWKIRLHFQGRIISQARNQSEAGSKQNSAEDGDNKFLQTVVDVQWTTRCYITAYRTLAVKVITVAGQTAEHISQSLPMEQAGCGTVQNNTG